MTAAVVLSIAGSDPSGGAGIQADLKSFQDAGAYGMAVVTALTVQNTQGVQRWMPVPADFVRDQIRAVVDDMQPAAIKIGMVGAASTAQAIHDALVGYRGTVVLDPVMVATSGDVLLDPDAEAALRTLLVPMATLLTPNLPETRRLVGDQDVGEWAMAHQINVLRKDGHGDGSVVQDRLFFLGGGSRVWRHPRITTRNTHGTGCTLSSAIAARLARGQDLESAVSGGIVYLGELLARSAGSTLGKGAHGPLLHGPVGEGALARAAGGGTVRS